MQNLSAYIAPWFQSLIPNGTPPLIVDSLTLVTNLNADLLDGQHGSYYVPGARTITINGTTLDLSQDRSWTISGSGGIENQSATPQSASFNITGVGQLGEGGTVSSLTIQPSLILGTEGAKSGALKFWSRSGSLYALIQQTDTNFHIDSSITGSQLHLNWFSQAQTIINGQGGNVSIGTAGGNGYKLEVSGTTRFNGVMEVANNLTIPAANGRYLGFTDFTAGMTLDFRFGSINNRLVNTFGAEFMLESVHGVVVSNLNGSTNVGPALRVNAKNTFRPIQEWNNASAMQSTMFYNGNLLLQNGGVHTDNGYKLEVGGTVKIGGVLTLGTLIGAGTQMLVVDNAGVVSSQTITSGTAGIENQSVTPQTASFDISGSGAIRGGALFGGNVNLISTNGAYLGFTDFVGGMTVDFRFGDAFNRLVNTYGSTLNLESYHGSLITNNASGISTALRVQQKSTNAARNIFELGRSTTYQPQLTMFNNGNILLQANGTHTDAGFKFDVNGTTRLQGVVTLSNLAGVGTQMVVADIDGNLSKQTIPSGGSGGYTVVNKTASYTEATTSGTIIIEGNTTSSSFTITLPTAVGNTAMIVIKKRSSSNILTIATTSSQTIDSGLTAVLVSLDESITLVSNNTNWLII